MKHWHREKPSERDRRYGEAFIEGLMESMSKPITDDEGPASSTVVIVDDPGPRPIPPWWKPLARRRHRLSRARFDRMIADHWDRLHPEDDA